MLSLRFASPKLPFGHPLQFPACKNTVIDAALVGGGKYPRPGEVSLAHHRVLFLDELPEFKKNVLEVLRQPMEDGRVTICFAIVFFTSRDKYDESPAETSENVDIVTTGI